MRKEFEMTQQQLDKILDACQPVPMIMLQCGQPSSPQLRANDAWEALGKEMGFHYMTVRESTKGPRFFTAEEVQLEWRWVTDKGHAMTKWGRSALPPILEVADSKGVMKVETRIPE